MKEEWKSVCMVCGVQSAIMVGAQLMQQWCADSWAILLLVGYITVNNFCVSD